MDKYNNFFEIFPTNKMSFERKVYAITRLIVLLSIVGFLITRSINFLVAGVVTIGAIIVLYYYQINKENNLKKQRLAEESNVEGFEEIKTEKEMKKLLREDYIPTAKTNPLGNVLLTEYTDNPLRKPAPPSFNPVVSDDVTSNIKKTVQNLNSTIVDTNNQLFGGLYDKFDLDQSNRAFYSTAITTIPNDQGAYASFLYGTMPSGKLDAEQRVKDNLRYLLY